MVLFIFNCRPLLQAGKAVLNINHVESHSNIQRLKGHSKNYYQYFPNNGFPNNVDHNIMQPLFV